MNLLIVEKNKWISDKKTKLQKNWRGIYCYLRTNGVSFQDCEIFVLNLYMSHEDLAHLNRKARVSQTNDISKLSKSFGFSSTSDFYDYLLTLGEPDEDQSKYIPTYLELQISVLSKPFNPKDVLADVGLLFSNLSPNDIQSLLIYMLHGASQFFSRKRNK
jgi:hypothetical protein